MTIVEGDVHIFIGDIIEYNDDYNGMNGTGIGKITRFVFEVSS